MESQPEMKNELNKIFDSKTRTINVLELKKMIESAQTEYQLLIDGVDSLDKIITENDNYNPLQSFNDNQIMMFFQSLLRLKYMLMHTTYDIKVKDIIKYSKSKIPVETNNAFISSLSELDINKEETLKFKSKGIEIEGMLDHPKILNGKFSNPHTLFYFVENEVLPMISQKILSINAHDIRYELIQKSINFLCILFNQTQLEVRIQKNTLIENRIFFSKYDKEVQSRETNMLKSMGTIINEGLLCPSDMNIQGLLFKLLRRLYGFWSEKVYSVLFLNIRNISLYSNNNNENHAQLIKEVSMFLYKIIYQKSDIKFVDLLENCDELHYLKESQFYNSKAFTYSSQNSKIYDINIDQFPFWSHFKHIGSRQVWTRVVIITKPNSLLTWEFNLLNYDIRFGIFKVAKTKKYTIDEYENKQNCKQIVKLQKYGESGDKKKTKGNVFVKNGVYHVVFDNSYSMVRGKDIIYNVKELQSIM